MRLFQLRLIAWILTRGFKYKTDQIKSALCSVAFECRDIDRKKRLHHFISRAANSLCGFIAGRLLRLRQSCRIKSEEETTQKDRGINATACPGHHVARVYHSGILC